MVALVIVCVTGWIESLAVDFMEDSSFETKSNVELIPLIFYPFLIMLTIISYRLETSNRWMLLVSVLTNF